MHMKSLSIGALALLALTVCAPQQRAPKQLSDGSESRDRTALIPFFDSRWSVAEYNGPGREDPAPEGFEEVGIAWFGPGGGDAAPTSGMWNAAALALSEINDAGGYKGRAFRLVPVWSADPWGTGVKNLAQLVYEQNLWAIVGGPDGPSTHLAEQLVATDAAVLPLADPNHHGLLSVACGGEHLGLTSRNCRVASNDVLAISIDRFDPKRKRRDVEKERRLSSDVFDRHRGRDGVDVLVERGP